MKTFAIIIDNKNYKSLMRYFLSVLFDNGYTWADGTQDLGGHDIYNEKKLILGLKKDQELNPILYQGTLSYYNGDYSSLTISYDLKNIYDVNNHKDINLFLKTYNIKKFNFSKYFSLIHDNKNIMNVLYGKKKLVENINIKKFKDF